MRYEVRLTGTSGLICHNGAAGLDTRSAANIEKRQIAAKRGSNRTQADDERLAALECFTSLYFDSDGRPTFPESAIRAMIEAAARKTKMGPAVREGLVVERVTAFTYDVDGMGATAEELMVSAQFTVPVVVQRSRVLRTRAKFDDWSIAAVLECDDALVEQSLLEEWLDLGGRRIGLGDWRPQKSGHYGRFTATVTPLE